MLRTLLDRLHRRHEPCREDGCCSCGAALGDINLEPTPGLPFGENYCWTCIHTWPADIPIPPYYVLPGARPHCPYCGHRNGRHTVGWLGTQKAD